MSPYWFILTTLAVWRVVVFIRQDALIEGTRDRVTVALARRDALWARKLLYLLDCPWCIAVWVAGAAVVAWEVWLVDFHAVTGVTTWLALSCAVPVLDVASEKL